MIYLIGIVSSFLSGMGIGGGSIFILFSLLLNALDLNKCRTYNLAMFVFIGIAIALNKFSNIKKNKKQYIIAIIVISIGTIIGFLLNKIISENSIKIVFYLFLLVIGIYEIISSLKNIKLDKNNNMKGEN